MDKSNKINHIMVIEDDKKYIEQINNIIDHKFKKCMISYTLASGKDALRILSNEEITISIIILNIRIAYENGLDLIAEIKEKNTKVRIILLSEYNYNEFMKRAINEKIDDYILMPCNDYEIENGIQVCLEKLQEIALSKERIETALTGYREARVYIENSFIYAMLFSNSSTSEIKNYQRILEISDRGMVISLDILQEDLKEEGRRFSYQRLYEIIHNFDCCLYNFVVGPMIKNRIILFLSLLSENDMSQDYEKMTNKIRETIQEKLSCEIKMGIGSVKKLVNIYSSYQESINSSNNKKNQSTMQEGDYYKKLESQFLSSLRLKDGHALEYLSTMLQLIKKEDDTLIQNLILELLAVIKHTIGDFKSNINMEDNFLTYLLRVKDIPISELPDWLFNTVECIQNSRMNQKRMYSEVVWDSMKIIQANYAKSVSLEGVAKLVGVSPQYLSKIFKEETNITFVEWVTKLRIDRASELIQDLEQGQSIKEVGVLVGYKDPNYFSRIFRNVVGMTPSEYRDKAKKKVRLH